MTTEARQHPERLIAEVARRTAADRGGDVVGDGFPLADRVLRRRRVELSRHAIAHRRAIPEREHTRALDDGQRGVDPDAAARVAWQVELIE